MLSPLLLIGQPLWYLGSTLVTISWLNVFTSEGKERKQKLEALRKARKQALNPKNVSVPNPTRNNGVISKMSANFLY